MSLCQKLQNFFEESKSFTNLCSLEYISTSLMISAKIFENEEEVKTFKKHAKFCNRSIEFLKAIELELLGKLNWNIDHSCIFDFGIYYFSNYLFHNQDLIQIGRNNDIEYSWIDFHSYMGSTLGLGSKDISSVREMFYNNRKMKKILSPVIQVQHIKKNDFNRLTRVIMSNFSSVLKSIQLKYALKSNVKIILVTYLLIFLKEYFLSKTYTTYQVFKEYLCSSILKYADHYLDTNN
jgi:hypothetical protein